MSGGPRRASPLARRRRHRAARQARRHELEPGAAAREATPALGSQGRPRRHARPDGHRHAATLFRACDQGLRPAARLVQVLPARLVRLGVGDRHRRRRGQRHRGAAGTRAGADCRSRPSSRASSGPSEQVPPMYSALKRDGRPLYELGAPGRARSRARPGASTSTGCNCCRSAPRKPRLRGRLLEGHLRAGRWARRSRPRSAPAGTWSALRSVWVEPFAAAGMVSLDEVETAGGRGRGRGGRPAWLLPVDLALPDRPRIELDATAGAAPSPGAASSSHRLARPNRPERRPMAPTAASSALVAVECGWRDRVERLFVSGDAGSAGPATFT